MIAAPNCYKRKCKHYIGVKNFSSKVEGDERNICEAFKDGIPHEIAYGSNLHTESFKGDNGILFEPIEDEKEKE
jgi:hypothetical protein